MPGFNFLVFRLPRRAIFYELFYESFNDAFVSACHD